MSPSPKHMTLSGLASLAAFTASVALAQTGAAQAGSETVTVTAPAAYVLPVRSADDRAYIAGSYQLSDGRRLSLRTRGRAMVAELDGLPSTELRPEGMTTLSSADKRMTLRFNRDRDDNPLVTVSLAVDGAATQALVTLPASNR